MRLSACALICLALTGTATAGVPGPICRLPTVVAVMAREMRTRDHYSHIDPRLVGEQPTNEANIVSCGVCVQTLTYDARLLGGSPALRCEIHEFQVHAVQNGFVVYFIR